MKTKIITNQKTLLILFLLLFFGSSNLLRADVKYSVSETEFNFGKVAQHALINNSFWIKSTGTDTLRISNVDPGCGCTKTPLGDSVLAPGDSTLLRVFYNTRRFRGNVIKKPSFLTNASDEKVYLKIYSEPIPKPELMSPIQIIPFKVDISQFSEKPRTKSSFIIYNAGKIDFDLKLIKVSSEFFEIELPDKLPAGEKVKAMVILHDDAIEQEFEDSFTFEINDDFNTRFSLPVKRIVRIKKK